MSKDNAGLPVTQKVLSKKVRNAMVLEACTDAADLYERWTSELQDFILTKSNSAHPDAMPPGVREAVMLGTIQAAMISHMALMNPETQAWAKKALEEGLEKIDVNSLLGGLLN